MAKHHVQAIAVAQSLRQLLGEIDGAVLAARATERNHQMLESPPLVFLNARIDQRQNAREKLVHALLLIQVFNDGRVASGERFKLFEAARVGQAAAVEDKAAAVAGLVFGPAPVKRETEDANRKRVGRRSDVLQLLRCQHAVEGAEQRRQLDRQLDVVQQPSQVLQRIRHALQEVRLALVEAAESVGSQRLHDADVNESVVVAEKFFAIEPDVIRELVDVVVQQLLAKFRRKVGFGVVEQGRDVVLQGALASTLVVDEVGLAVDQHYVAGLEVAVEEIILRRAEQ